MEQGGSAQHVNALSTILHWICAILHWIGRKSWPILEGFFLDVPRVIDHAWRHTEYRLNAECDHKPGWTNPQGGPHEPGEIAIRRFYKKPAFWFFAVTVFFASYGPNWDALCAVAPKLVMTVLRDGLAAAIFGASLVLFGILVWPTQFLIEERFDEVCRNEWPLESPLPCRRRAVSYITLYMGLLAVPAAGIAIGWFLLGDAPGGVACALNEWNLTAIWRLLLCIAIVALFAWLTSSNRMYEWFAAAFKPDMYRVTFDVVVQLSLFLILALVQWLILSKADAREANDLPYRHVFLVWVPSIALVMALTPWWAHRRFRTALPELKQYFRDALRDTELFFQPKDPALSGRGIVYALIFAPVNHILPVLLFPALVAISVPEDWLNLAALGAFIFSLLLIVWGNMSPRWQELNTYIERWFLRGTPLLISLVVIVIAILRLVRFGYISTLLDDIPFGTVFGLVVMNYALFWLAEYWMSRAVAVELLRLLDDPLAETYVPYRPSFGPHRYPAIRVDIDERYLASHGTGRFVVLGNVRGTRQLCRAFQSYYLTETFARLDNDKESKWVAEIVERTGTYFLGLNIALIAVTAIFLTINVCGHRELTVQPVVTEKLTPPDAHPVDLSTLLERGSDSDRPAIVVIGSGGGTRAALYTASVLRGLHRLGVDRDIVLASGVSGGGVALAYFAANRAILTETGATAQSKFCSKTRDRTHSVDDEWDCFAENLGRPFIEDVLNGATEWRIFYNTALSALLAESFERDLFGDRQVGSIDKVGLILNTAVVSHPAETSAGLTKTLNTAKSCAEAEQVFKLMSGGRLIFTNLHDFDALTRQAPDPSLPDVRLPYQIVGDPTVLAAKAAALNANFPPVFPAARVRVLSVGASAPCPPYRTFYVTDGGAEENLGLISALYALESALDKLKARNARARPIHVVIAEASALEYDYSQDRAVSLLFGGGPAGRLAGGLTRELRDLVNTRLRELNGASSDVRYHLLGLPVAFRSRGGFGTHWLYAQSFSVHDPRLRKPGLLYSLFDSGKEQVTINRATLERMWSALHDPKTPFCSPANFDDDKALKVQSWICGPAQGDKPGRDLHMAAWQELVHDMDTNQKP